MKLRKLHIRNFRGIKDLELELDDTTVLIGENNSGKTAVLDALRLCLRDLGSRHRVVFDTFDFHLKDADAEPSSTDPIEITLTFSEDAEGDWDGQLVGRLSRQKALHINSDDRSQVVLHVTCTVDRDSRDFAQDWKFLGSNGEPLAGVAETALSVLQREVSCYYLGALRDAAWHFGAKGPFWQHFLKDNQLSIESKEKPETKEVPETTLKEVLESKLKEVNDLVVASHASFKDAQERLSKIQGVVPMAPGDDLVSIEAVPGRMFDILAKAQIHLGTSTGAKLPVVRHGEGTQSLAVLMLFSAFLDVRPRGAPIVALEEPEAHLHPSAVRSLWSVVKDIAGQKLISTHSGDLLSEIDVHNVRRLARTAAGVRSYRVPAGALTDEETRKFNYHVRRARGELLFARCWLLVEGETEGWIFPAAARALGIDLHRAGVRVVEYSQSAVGLLAKVANGLGIPWYCVVDDDSGRQKYEPAVKENLGRAAEADRLSLPYRNAEIHLLSNGYDAEYTSFMPQQNLERVQKNPGESGYWEEYASHLPGKAKTRGAATVAAEMERRGRSGVTKELRDILDKVVTLAGGA